MTTSGTHLVLNGRPWYLYGASTYETSNPFPGQSIPDEISLATSAGLNTLRIVNMIDENGVDTTAPTAEASWTRVDQLLAAMQVAGLHAILDLSAFRNYLQNHELYTEGAAAIGGGYSPPPNTCNGRSGDDLTRCVGGQWCIANASSCTDPYSPSLTTAWDDFLSFVANRVNTVTHIAYRNDPTIAIVSFAGEPNPPNSGEPLKPTKQELTDFYSRVFTQWKTHDTNHLVTSGGLLHIDWQELYGSDSGIDYAAIFALPNQDVLSIHNYFGSFPPTAAHDYKTPKVAAAAATDNKPWITEEFGFTQQPSDGTNTYAEADRGAWFKTVYDIQRDPSAGVPAAGVAFWNLGPEVAGGSHDVNPSTPATWATVQRYAPSGLGWQAAQTLSTSSFRAFYPVLTSNGLGRASVLWSAYDPGNPLNNTNLAAMDRQPGGAWQALPPIQTASVQQNLQVETNAAGASIVTWVQGLSVWASYRPAGGSWGAPQLLDSASNGVYFPSAAIDDSGEAVVAWYRSTSPSNAAVRTAFRSPSGAWAAAEGHTFSTRNADFRPHIAYDANGEAVLTWESLQDTYYAIAASTHPRGGAWSAPVQLSTPNTSVDDPSLAGNRNGTVVATWIDVNHVIADVRSGGSWGGPTALASMTSSLANEPRTAIDRAGDATVIWDRYDGTNWRTEASTRPAGGSFQPVADTLATGFTVPSSSYAPVQIATDPDGDVVAAWVMTDGSNGRIEAARKPAGGSWQPVPDVLSPHGVNADFPAVTIDPTGLATVAWTLPSGPGGNELLQAVVSSRSAPGAYLVTPADGATLAFGSSAHAAYSCSDEPDGPGIATCTGTLANGAALDTSTPGSHTFAVTATDNAGGTSTVTHHYTVGQPLGIHVSGTQIVDAGGVPLVLRGVDYSGTEYMCVQGSPTPTTHGRGIFEGPTNTPTPPSALAAWGINAVRLPLNEDCWLGINNVDPAFGGASYRTAITSYVNALVAQGIVPILELSGAAPGTQLAGVVDQQPMPDRDHSADFWRDVATMFAGNGRVVFDLYNEPFPDNNQDTVAAWTCWRDGGLACPGSTYDAVGMQELVDTVRAAGAQNLIVLGGVQFSRIDSDWLTYRPIDSAGNVAMSWHLYPNTYCPNESCWDSQFQPILTQTAAVATEIGQGGTAPCGADFLDRVTVWLDAHSQGYLAWTWDAWGDCFSLIANWGENSPPYAPTSPYGRAYHDHLLGYPQPPTGVVAAAGDAVAAVTWVAPTDHGPGSIQSYVVTPHDQTAGVDRPWVTTAGTSTTVPGLTNGHAYTFAVAATNATGTGAPSSASVAVTPQAGYPPPAAATGTASPTSATTVQTSTDPATSGGTATAITVPSGTAGGPVSVQQTGTTVAAPAGYLFGNVQVDISAPAGTATNPLTLVFTMTPAADQAPPPDPGTLAAAEIYRAEGAGAPVLVPDCTGPAGQAEPDGSPCVSSRQYVTIGGRTYIRLTVLSATASHWLAGRPKPAAVTVTARGYQPASVTVQPGAFLNWSFTDGKNHSVTDAIGLGVKGAAWFDSGARKSGSYRFSFPAAGTFPYRSTVNGDSIAGVVNVPPVATPAAGRVSTLFAVAWSTTALSGYVFDVKLRFKAANSKKWTNWVTWKNGVTTTSAAFAPNQGAGTYDFQAHLRNKGTGRTSGDSPDLLITVSP